jgi:hypothetical protein
MTQEAMCGFVRYREAEATGPACLPLAAPLPPNCIAQPLQNLNVQMASKTLSSRYELVVQQTVDIKEFWELFD